ASPVVYCAPTPARPALFPYTTLFRSRSEHLGPSLTRPMRDELTAVFLGGALGALLRAGLSEALPHGATGWPWGTFVANLAGTALDRKSTRLNSSHVKISYAVFRLNKE